MNVRISTQKNEDEKSYIKGWASVNFDGQFVLNNITVREKKDGSLYVKMPQRNAVQLNEETGLKERVNVASFAPANKESASELNAAILDTFLAKSNSKSYVLDCEMSVKGAKAYYVEKDPNKPNMATLSIDLGDFYVTAAYLQKGSKGNLYVRNHAAERSIPGNNGKQETKYIDDFHPITEKGAKDIIAVCKKAYETAKGIAQQQNAELIGSMQKFKPNPSCNPQITINTESDSYDDMYDQGYHLSGLDGSKGRR